MGHVYYHHPGDKQFSLDFVHQDSEEIIARIIEYDDEVSVKVEEYNLETEFYVVYTSRSGGKAVNDIDLNVSETLAEMSNDNGTIVARLLEMYQALISKNEKEEGVPVEAYKNPNIGELESVLEQVRWEGAATDIAGRLASNLILKHALPNANHRTAVALIQFYLRRLEPNFSMPETAIESFSEEYDWREWVNNYINESKRILTVRRKNIRFKYLREFGTTTIERKHGVQIDLTAYKLDLYPSEAKEIYAKEHEQLWIEFVEEAVNRAGESHLIDSPGLSKAQFAEKIRNLK